MERSGVEDLTLRLTEALNDAIAKRPAEPLAAMAAFLRSHADAPPGEPIDSVAGATLLPEVTSYLEEHRIREELEEMINGLRSNGSSGAASLVGPAADALAAPRRAFRTTAEVRSAFIDFFADKAAHSRWPSSPVVPHDDPTLLFINAGMNQFKPLFLGQCKEGTAMSKLKRAANSQKCIRAGGKHNDLDDVGKDVYHHTFFEMLGNWSFGDYFKEEAIAWAWQLLTEVYRIPPERLYVTYFEGNEALGVPADTEARDIWAKYVPPERILAGNMKDNFWEMGDTGPCGPCSEIHYDRIGGRDASHLVNDGCVGRNGEPIPAKGAVVKGHTVGVPDPNVLEIWNNVFMQFNRERDGSLTPLPAPCVDTGMGLERVSSILLDKMSNYDIDVFAALFKAIQAVVPGLREYAGKVGEDMEDAAKWTEDERVDMAFRVVADHIRTLTFAITDGAQPSAEGRGYVLRRILRRAVRYGGEILKAPEGFFHQLVDAVVEQFGDAFPELRKDPERVKAILREEEATFSRTLKNGIRQLGKYCEKLPAGGTLSGEEAFKMYDTYGFPVDLTLLMCEEKGLTVDEAGYEAEMERAKERSRDPGSFSRGGSVVLEAEQTVALAERMGVPRTDDAPKWVWDSAAGAGQPHASTLRAAIDPSKVFHESVTAETGLVGLIVESTPFYAEAGGQVCDLGTLTTAAGAAFLVEDVQRFGAFVTHIGRVTAGELKPGDAVQLCVDYGRRAPIAQNHTTTHMLNYALRAALEQDCDQRGSLCDAEKLRFDFAYPKPLTAEQLAAVQAQVNSQIGADLEVHTSTVALEQAMAINGLRAVFGQQCRTAHGADPALGSILRRPGVGQMVAAPDQGEWRGYSVEFCGGTHIARSSEPQRFVLLSEEGLGGGNRRIVGLTGERAAAANATSAELMARIDKAGSLEGKAIEPETAEIARLLETAVVPAADRKAMTASIGALKKRAIEAGKGNLKAAAEAAKAEAVRLAEAAQGARYLALLLETEADAKVVEAAATAAGAALVGVPLLVLGAGKTACALATAPDGSPVDAKEWVNAALGACGGKGGGKPNRAQGAARDPTNVAQALEAARAFAEAKLG